MKVAILGSGDVGQALAKAFKSEGHEVQLATRDTKSDKAKSIKDELGIEVHSFAQVAEWCELVVLCVLYTALEDVVSQIRDHLKNKVVIDVTNPLDLSSGMPPSLLIGTNDSAGEEVQRKLPQAKVVKALNSVGNGHMYKPQFDNVGDITPTMFYCGNDKGAKEIVHTILLSFGWSPVDIGDITGSRELEPLCILWVKYGMATNTWNHAFTMLTQDK